MDWTTPPYRSISSYVKRNLCLNLFCVFRYGFYLGQLTWTLIGCKGGLYASLFDGIRMTMYVCNILCALYNIHATHGKSIFFSAYMIFLYSLQFGSLRFWSSREHMWDLSNKLGQLPRIPGILYGSTCSGFHMDLLVLLWPYGPIRYLYSEGGTLHYTSLLNQAPRPKGSASAVCWLGVFSV